MFSQPGALGEMETKQLVGRRSPRSRLLASLVESLFWGLRLPSPSTARQAITVPTAGKQRVGFCYSELNWDPEWKTLKCAKSTLSLLTAWAKGMEGWD